MTNKIQKRGSESAEAVAWDDPAVDPIVSKLYRKFKEWSQRGFTADDVTWCEVRGYVAELLNTTPPTTGAGGVPEPCDHENTYRTGLGYIICYQCNKNWHPEDELPDHLKHMRSRNG